MMACSARGGVLIQLNHHQNTRNLVCAKVQAGAQRNGWSAVHKCFHRHPQPLRQGQPLASTSPSASHHSHQHPWLLYILPIAYPCTLGLASMTLANNQAACALPLLATPVLLLHVITPLFDCLLKEYDKPVQALRPLPPNSGAQFLSRLLPFLYVMLHLCASTLAYSAASDYSHLDLSLLVAATGVSAAVGSAAAHELIHSRCIPHCVAGVHLFNLGLLLAVFWSRCMPHNRAGELFLIWTWHWAYIKAHHHHHKTVGTPQDHATARKGEPYLHFLPRYLLGGWAVAWKEEMKEAARKRQMAGSPSKPAVFVPWRLLSALAVQMGITLFLGMVFGAAAVKVHLGAAAMSQSLLALVDYGLHYGLKRAVQPDGKYDPLTPFSSFNSAFPLENATLFSVLCHSDHHLVAAKPHTDLGLSWPIPEEEVMHSHQEGWLQGNQKETLHGPLLLPRIPMSAILLVALFLPPLWFSIVDPHAEAANQQHKLCAQGLPASQRAST